MNVHTIAAEIAPVVVEKLRSAGNQGSQIDRVTDWVSEAANYQYRGTALTALTNTVLTQLKGQIVIWETTTRRVALKQGK